MSRLLVRFRTEAEKDIEVACAWYENAQLGLSKKFLLELFSVTDRLIRFPQSGNLVRRGMRRAYLQRIPYIVSYHVTEGELNILGVSHAKSGRNPFTVHES